MLVGTPLLPIRRFAIEVLEFACERVARIRGSYRDRHTWREPTLRTAEGPDPAIGRCSPCALLWHMARTGGDGVPARSSVEVLSRNGLASEPDHPSVGVA